ncbi:MAG: hypothetical protein Q4F54_04785 [Coriobacteriia bacterium]|nr:hypothetical protein [Coriobacteriia bacterium]
MAKADMGQVSSRTVISREELERRMRQSSALYYNPYSSSSTATTTTYSNL